jgi:hypothetical protein
LSERYFDNGVSVADRGDADSDDDDDDDDDDDAVVDDRCDDDMRHGLRAAWQQLQVAPEELCRSAAWLAGVWKQIRHLLLSPRAHDKPGTLGGLRRPCNVYCENTLKTFYAAMK